MKIGIVYFSESLPADRRHHEVTHELISSWVYFYKKSGCRFDPVLLTDGRTLIPACWEYDHQSVKEPEPPIRRDVLNKVGWIKSQAYEELGKCMVMDLDAMIVGDINELETYEDSMMMAFDPARRVYRDWVEVGCELNAGIMLFNSHHILTRFLYWWSNKQEFMNITYFDELIFSAICRELDGTVLDSRYNTSWDIGNHKEMIRKYKTSSTKIMHFHGLRKEYLKNFRMSMTNYM
jgi:hypothetical protein